MVLNASQIARQLRFPLLLRTLAIPTVVALNMSDQSRRFGISIDASGLAEIPQECFDALLAQFVQLPPRLLNRRTRLVDRLLLHPLVGPVLFLAIVLAMFPLLYAVGAGLSDRWNLDGGGHGGHLPADHLSLVSDPGGC